MYPKWHQKTVSPARMLQANNLFALRDRAAFSPLFIKPSYLYQNLTAQLCRSVGRDKASGKEAEQATMCIINYESRLKTHLLIDFDEIYLATGFCSPFHCSHLADTGSDRQWQNATLSRLFRAEKSFSLLLLKSLFYS